MNNSIKPLVLYQKCVGCTSFVLVHASSLYVCASLCQCTRWLNQCSPDEQTNAETINDYNATWGIIGLKFNCLVDLQNEEYVLRHLAIKGSDVFHSMFWPGLLTLIGLGMCLFTLILEACSLAHEGYFFTDRKCFEERRQHSSKNVVNIEWIDQASAADF